MPTLVDINVVLDVAGPVSEWRGWSERQLLTRDLKRYRVYFPALTIIAPETHP